MRGTGSERTSVMNKTILVIPLSLLSIGGVARADYLPEAYAGCAEVHGNNPRITKRQEAADYKKCLVETDKFLRSPPKEEDDTTADYNLSCRRSRW